MKAILSEGQLEVYKEFYTHQKSSQAEGAAIFQLSRFPITLKLSEEQKDIIYRNLYAFGHEASKEKLDDELLKFTASYNFDNSTSYHTNDLRSLWAAKDILTQEQLSALLADIKRMQIFSEKINAKRMN